jgi:hypothetical protein
MDPPRCSADKIFALHHNAGYSQHQQNSPPILSTIHYPKYFSFGIVIEIYRLVIIAEVKWY